MFNTIAIDPSQSAIEAFFSFGNVATIDGFADLDYASLSGSLQLPAQASVPTPSTLALAPPLLVVLGGRSRLRG